MARFRSPVVPVALQDLMVQRHFPGFKYAREKNLPTWRGNLQPSDTSPSYAIKIVYQFDNQYSKSPRVWVISPSLHPKAPHRFLDNSLCLYYPKDHSWTPYDLIALSIIPWTSFWLRCYEIWLETDYWYGPEAPHPNHLKKKKPDLSRPKPR